MIVAPDRRYEFTGQYIVFVAVPEEDGAEGLVTHALGPFENWELAQRAAQTAARNWPTAFVRWSPLRPPGPGEGPGPALVSNDAES